MNSTGTDMKQKPEQQNLETIYIRVSREQITVFLVCQLNEIIENIKKQLVQFYKTDPGDMRLYLGNRLLDPTSTIYDQDVKNNSLIQLKLKNKMGEYEP